MKTTNPVRQPEHNIVKGKDVIGLKVLSLENGKFLNDVDELVYDPKDERVKALVIDEGGWFAQAKIILYDEVKSIGRDAVIVSSEKAVKKASDVKDDIERILKDDNYLTANKVVTESGTELGQVSDILFDASTGQVKELEVSQGALQNMQSGKKHVKVGDIMKVGTDVTVVRGFVEEKMKEQSEKQGIKGAAFEAKNRTPGFIEETKSRLAEFGEKAKDKARDLSDRTQEKSREISGDHATREKLDSARIRAHDAANAIKENTTRAKDTVAGKVEEGRTRYDEARKTGAVGKYVTVNILSRTDKILARRGDMITNRLIAEAEENGMLDQVLSNTSDRPLPSGTTSPSRPKKTP